MSHLSDEIETAYKSILDPDRPGVELIRYKPKDGPQVEFLADVQTGHGNHTERNSHVIDRDNDTATVFALRPTPENGLAAELGWADPQTQDYIVRPGDDDTVSRKLRWQFDRILEIDTHSATVIFKRPRSVTAGHRRTSDR